MPGLHWEMHSIDNNNVPVPVAGGGLFGGNGGGSIGGGNIVVLSWLAKEFCIMGIIDVAPTISIDDIATTLMISFMVWLIIIYLILYS